MALSVDDCWCRCRQCCCVLELLCGVRCCLVLLSFVDVGCVVAVVVWRVCVCCCCEVLLARVVCVCFVGVYRVWPFVVVCGCE